MSIDSRVAAGMLWLALRFPGWWASLDLDSLNCRVPRCCVLGQLYGDYTTAHAIINKREENTHVD
jgi:hypothetical protein